MDNASTSNGEYKFKVVLLGEGSVGKSSLVLRYVEDKFQPRHISTVQASFLSKQLRVDDCNVELNIWDTAGQERYHALGPIYYRGSQGALLIFDMTDQQSFEKVRVWIKELRRSLGDECVIFIVGNKLDLASNRTVEQEMAKNYAAEVGAEYVETSAKENIGVSNLFEQITSRMITSARSSASHRNSTRNPRRTIQLVDDPPKRSKCC